MPVRQPAASAGHHRVLLLGEVAVKVAELLDELLHLLGRVIELAGAHLLEPILVVLLGDEALLLDQIDGLGEFVRGVGRGCGVAVSIKGDGLHMR